MTLRRPGLARLGAKTIGELLAMKAGLKVLLAGTVIARQRSPTAKGMCFLILTDESGRIPTAVTPQVYEKFERVIRQPMLLVDGQLEVVSGTPRRLRWGRQGFREKILAL